MEAVDLNADKVGSTPTPSPTPTPKPTPCLLYTSRIDSLASYYYCNMRLLEPAVCDEIFNGPNRIYTKVKDQVPTIYGDNAQVSNSLIADGCVIAVSYTHLLMTCRKVPKSFTGGGAQRQYIFLSKSKFKNRDLAHNLI